MSLTDLDIVFKRQIKTSHHCKTVTNLQMWLLWDVSIRVADDAREAEGVCSGRFLGDLINFPPSWWCTVCWTLRMWSQSWRLVYNSVITRVIKYLFIEMSCVYLPFQLWATIGKGMILTKKWHNLNFANDLALIVGAHQLPGIAIQN